MSTTVSSGIISSGLSLTGDSMYIAGGGIASGTIIDSAGRMYVSSGAVANSTTIKSSGYMRVFSGGIANNTKVFWDGRMYLSGGTANNTRISRITHIYDTSSNTYFGSMFISRGGTANSTSVAGYMFVSSGGTANSTTVNPGGYMYVSRGGTANSTSVAGYMFVSSGGTANNTTLDPHTTYGSTGGVMFVESRGIAKSTTVNRCGSMYVSSGGTANNTTLNSGGYMAVYSGCVANSITLNEGGRLYIYSARVNNTTVNSGAKLRLESCDIASRTTVNSGGYMSVASGGMITGKLKIESGATVSVYSGAIIDFSVAEQTDTAVTLIQNWNLILNANQALHTCTVNADQGQGTYSLASNASTFNQSVTVKNTDGVELGTVSLTDTFILGEFQYALTLNESVLNLTIKDIEKPNITSVSGPPADWTKEAAIIVSANDNIGVIDYAVTTENSTANAVWQKSGTFNITENGTYYFWAKDEAGNIATAKSITVDRIDKDAPELKISGNTAGWSNKDVTITANATDAGSGVAMLEYSLDGKVWMAGNSRTFEQSGTIHFRATDNAGNIASETVEVKIDMSAPIVKVTDITDGKITADFADLGGFAVKLYSLNNGGTWQEYTESVTVEAGKIVLFKAVDNAGNESEILRFDTAVPLNDVKIDEPTDVKLTTGVTGSILLKATGNITIISGQEIKYEAGKVTENVAVLPQIEPKILTAVEDGAADIFLARKYDVWSGGEHVARHTGIKDAAGSWFGTREAVELNGRNKIADVFNGCEDANILYLTDDANGDALFVDDIYTENPGGGARIAKIDEIRAGDGDDVVDFTSQRFDYDGDGVIIRGGLGDDTIWSNNGENFLFGDEGNDRIVGGLDSDVIVGGIGDDSMQGGGGDDTFCFGGNWGNDVVEQLSNGSVTIWFGDSIVESDLTIKRTGQGTEITCGKNSITVKNLAEDEIKFKFGGEADYESLAAIGAFSDYTSKKIFEDNAEDKNLVIAILQDTAVAEV